MATFNPLVMILSHQKLMDDNNYSDYNNWKMNLRIVLDYENIKFVLTTPKPQEPATNASELVQTTYLEWQKANMSARYYILDNVSSHFHKEISKLESAAEMIQILDEMFAAKNNSFARQSAIKTLVCTHMTGGSVRDHCLKMMSLISQAEVMGAKLEQEMQIAIILESLPESFNQFKMTYNMNKLKQTPTQLMHELENAAKFLIKPNNIHLVETSIKLKEKPKGRNKNKEKNAVVPIAEPITMKKTKGKCFKCGHKGHWKQNCLEVTKNQVILIYILLRFA